MDTLCAVLHNEDGKVLGLQYPTPIENIWYFIELLQNLESKIRYFERYDLVLALPVGFGIASLLLNNPILDNYPFIRLVISEDFPNLCDGRRNRLLNAMCDRYPVWLGNLGSGSSNMVAVMEGMFDGLVLDAGFVALNRNKPIYEVVIDELMKYCNCMIVPGLSSGKYRPVRLRCVETLF